MNNKKINCSYAILVVILFAVVCFLTDYIIINRKMKENNCEAITGIITDCIDSTCNCGFDDNNSYIIFSNNLSDEISSDFNDYNYSMKYVENYFVPDGYTVRLDNNGILYVKYSVEDKERVIASNVLSFYLINTGQDLGNTLFFINNDGTVGKASTEYGYSSEKKIEIVNKIDGFNNIVSIVEGVYGDEYSGYHGPLFVDINGNIFKDN